MHASYVVTASLGLLNLESLEAEEAAAVFSRTEGGREERAVVLGQEGPAHGRPPTPVPGSPRASWGRAFGGLGCPAMGSGPTVTWGASPSLFSAPALPASWLCPSSRELAWVALSQVGGNALSCATLPWGKDWRPLVEPRQVGFVLGLLQGGLRLGGFLLLTGPARLSFSGALWLHLRSPAAALPHDGAGDRLHHGLEAEGV